MSQRNKCQQGQTLLEKQEQWQERLSTEGFCSWPWAMPKVGAVHVGEMAPEENRSLFPGGDQPEQETHLQRLCKP